MRNKQKSTHRKFCIIMLLDRAKDQDGREKKKNVVSLIIIKRNRKSKMRMFMR